MGSIIEINDTLYISANQGFPDHLLDIKKHREEPIMIEAVKDIIFECKDKSGVRFFQYDPCRVYLVQNINGKWLFWGQALIQSQSICKKINPDGSWTEGEWLTSCTYRIMELYPPEYQEVFTIHESPTGKSYF